MTTITLLLGHIFAIIIKNGKCEPEFSEMFCNYLSNIDKYMTVIIIKSTICHNNITVLIINSDIRLL